MQTESTDRFIVFLALAITTIAVLRIVRGDSPPAQKVLSVLAILLIDANLVEAVMAARVAAEHGISWGRAFGMHIIAAGLGAVGGYLLESQTLQSFRALSVLFRKETYQSFWEIVYAYTNFSKQTLEVFLALVLAIGGPLYNWISIAYQLGDIEVHNSKLFTATLGGKFWTIFDAFSMTGTMDDQTFMSGGAVMLHLVCVFAIVTMILDIDIFKVPKPDLSKQHVGWDNVTNFLEKHGYIQKQEIDAFLNANSEQKNILKSRIMFYAKNFFRLRDDIEKGNLDPDSTSFKRTYNEMEAYKNKLLSVFNGV